MWKWSGQVGNCGYGVGRLIGARGITGAYYVRYIKFDIRDVYSAWVSPLRVSLPHLYSYMLLSQRLTNWFAAVDKRKIYSRLLDNTGRRRTRSPPDLSSRPRLCPVDRRWPLLSPRRRCLCFSDTAAILPRRSTHLR